MQSVHSCLHRFSAGGGLGVQCLEGFSFRFLSLSLTSRFKMVAVASGCVAVTGASGLLGSHIVRVLLEKGYVVRAVVRNKVSS